MRVFFINPDTAHAYHADSPWERALSGTDSAQVHLAVALAARGLDVTLCTGAASSGMRRGVRCLHFDEGLGMLHEADAVFVTSAPYVARELRRLVAGRVPIFAWEHNVWNAEPVYAEALRALTGPNDYVLCVSDWHRKHFIDAGGLAPERVLTLKNAVSPVFLDLFTPDEDILASKIWPPVFSFTSAPYKGLEPTLELFAACRREAPTLTLNVFSSFDLYSPANALRADPLWKTVYDRARSAPGVNYVGNAPQPLLRRALRGSFLLFYPAVVAETSSICVMEAMAAGCQILVTPAGAIPETLAGFGEIVNEREGSARSEAFVRGALSLCEQFERLDQGLSARLREQVRYANEECTWARRAEQAEVLVVQAVRRAASRKT